MKIEQKCIQFDIETVETDEAVTNNFNRYFIRSTEVLLLGRQSIVGITDEMSGNVISESYDSSTTSQCRKMVIRILNKGCGIDIETLV